MATIPVCQVTATGIARPTFSDCLSYVVSSYQTIYGADTVLDADTQDGQLIRLFADVLHAANGAHVATYNAFAPSTAQGEGLSRSVGINGLTRKVASYSTCDVLVVGVADTVIAAGRIAGADGIAWALPKTVAIPRAGEIVVTATCTVLGAVEAPAGTLTTILTTQPGWQSVTNREPATTGAPVETDAQLRIRQRQSTALGARTMVASMEAEILNLANVARVRGYENATLVTDANGVPARSFALVVDGGAVAEIATVIGLQKPPGIPTIGDTGGIYTDGAGIPREIRFYRPTTVPISYTLQVRAKRGFTTDVQASIKAALIAFTDAAGIGGRIEHGGAYVPARLANGPGSETYSLVSLALARDAGETGPDDIALAFNEAPETRPEYIDIVVVP